MAVVTVPVTQPDGSVTTSPTTLTIPVDPAASTTTVDVPAETSTTTTETPTTTTTTAPTTIPAGARCPAYPAFPDAACTGPVGDLPSWTGGLEFGTDGQVFENIEIHADNALYVPTSNVTLRNVRIVWTGPMSGSWTTVVNEGVNNRLKNCEIDGQDRVARALWGDGTNLTVRGCDIHNTGNAVETATPLTVEERYFHDIKEPAGTDWHADGVQVWFGEHNITVRPNTILMAPPSTGAIQIQGDADNPNENVLVTQNLFAGGGYTMYTRHGPGNKLIDGHLSTHSSRRSGSSTSDTTTSRRMVRCEPGTSSTEPVHRPTGTCK